MRILHIVPGLEDVTCGIAVAAKIVAARQTAEGHEAVLVSSRKGCLKNLSREEWTQVWLHSMWSPSVLLAGMRLALRDPAERPRFVRMPHGCLDPVKIAYHETRKKALSGLEKFIFRHCDAIAATSKEEVAWCREFLEGAKTPVMEVSLAGPGAPGGVADGGKCRKFLYIGRLHPLKGVDCLVAALPEGASLEIIGRDNGEEAKLRKIARFTGKNVSFRGVVNEEEKRKSLASCDCLVLPTLSENYGLVIAEALAAGKIAVTTDGAKIWANHPRVRYIEGFVAADGKTRISLLKEVLEQLMNG